MALHTTWLVQTQVYTVLIVAEQQEGNKVCVCLADLDLGVQ